MWNGEEAKDRFWPFLPPRRILGKSPYRRRGVKAVSRNSNAIQRSLVPYLMLSPSYLFIGVLMLVPLVVAVLYSFQNYVVFDPLNRAFVGLGNYAKILGDPVFHLAVKNTLIWTGTSLILQFTLGLILALLINAGPFFGKPLYQALVFLPWAVPGFLIGMTWKWMFNAQFGVISDLLLKLHIISQPVGFLSSPGTALLSVVVANVWFGVPFFAITLLAGLQAIPYELYEAGSIEGASSARLFWHVTLPLLKPTIIVSTLLRVIWIANFPDLIYIMTEGGPANASQTLATYIFLTGYKSLDIGYSAGLSVVLFLSLVVFAVAFIKLTGFGREEA